MALIDGPPNMDDNESYLPPANTVFWLLPSNLESKVNSNIVSL